MKCSNCGNEIEQNNFCPFCGTPIKNMSSDEGDIQETPSYNDAKSSLESEVESALSPETINELITDMIEAYKVVDDVPIEPDAIAFHRALLKGITGNDGIPVYSLADADAEDFTCKAERIYAHSKTIKITDHAVYIKPRDDIYVYEIRSLFDAIPVNKAFDKQGLPPEEWLGTHFLMRARANQTATLHYPKENTEDKLFALKTLFSFIDYRNYLLPEIFNDLLTTRPEWDYFCMRTSKTFPSSRIFHFNFLVKIEYCRACGSSIDDDKHVRRATFNPIIKGSLPASAAQAISDGYNNDRTGFLKRYKQVFDETYS